MASLIEINASAYQYYLYTQERLLQIHNHLQNLGIPFMAYGKIFKNGTYLPLITNTAAEFLQIYFSTIKNNGFTYTNIINQTTNAKCNYVFFSNDINCFDKRKDPIMYLMYDFNLWKNILMIYKLTNLEFIECYMFGVEGNTAQATNFYLNNMPLLEHGIDYFNCKAKDLIDTSDKKKLAYFKQKLNFNIVEQEELILQQSKQFALNTKFNNNSKLSLREIDCLYHLSLGNSMKEIGRILNLSPRTVEHHLNNVKQKTGLLYKSQLVSEFLKNAPASLFK
ncbi:helix-turn-helix transcriptional regulator [Rickettsia endosymbiont of Ceutorhynchus obstrictus]|uniref:helix-turn-helix transcriptional regulator n=1 Tax=Rickettsia endosymbiont of Ceutorhynchus obstrictus TaxID=3066249 RepID=UPI003133080E